MKYDADPIAEQAASRLREIADQIEAQDVEIYGWRFHEELHFYALPDKHPHVFRLELCYAPKLLPKVRP